MLKDESERAPSAQNMAGEGDEIIIVSLADPQRKHSHGNVQRCPGAGSLRPLEELK